MPAPVLSTGVVPVSEGYPACVWVCVPLGTVIVITLGAAPAVNTSCRSLPLWATLKVPVPNELAKPPVPFAADVTSWNFAASNPVMPPVAVAIVQA